jgi:hypothetical protein
MSGILWESLAGRIVTISIIVGYAVYLIYKFLKPTPPAHNKIVPIENIPLKLNEPYTFVTDTATLAIFDPDVLKHRVSDEVDWLAEADFHEIKEVAAGDCALISLGADGAYKIIVSLTDLSSDEKQLTRGKLTLGVKVTSNQCFIGNGEALPGGDVQLTTENLRPHQGGFIQIESGLYDVDIYIYDESLLQKKDPNEEFTDFAIIFKPRTKPFVAPLGEPSIL